MNESYPKLMSLEDLQRLDPDKRYHLRVGGMNDPNPIIRFNLSIDELGRCYDPIRENFVEAAKRK